MNPDVLLGLDRAEDYLQRVRASVIRQDIYQSMSDAAELAEIARRLYRSLSEVSRQNAARVVNPMRREVT